MSELKLKQAIAQSLHHCLDSNLADCTQNLFQILGYQTDKSIRLDFPTLQAFLSQFDQGKGFNAEAARAEEWQFVDLVFQLTKDEITGSEQIRLNFEGSPRLDNTIIESYLFFAIALSGDAYTRSQLAGITREINKLFPMPVMLVFKHGKTLTLSIINRRLHAIDSLKVLDPAVGSGAFPMGMLQKLVFILGKLDPNNEVWKYQQKEREIRPVLEDLQQAQKISYEQAREAAIQQLEERLAEIEADFTDNEMDYPRKLFLIENSIYGVDIQPIAVQIAKLRFFISLIVEQRVDNNAPNRGILPLPNLETKFIAANTLMSIDRPTRDRLIAEHPSSGEVLKPFLRGRDVKRWRVDYQDLWLIFTRRGTDIKNYPAIHDYLMLFKDRLTPGIPGGRKPGSYQWYEIQDNIAYWEEFERSKTRAFSKWA